MSMEFVKAYKNFQKYEQERGEMASRSDDSERSTGLLAPRSRRALETSGQQSQRTELDKVADYVQQIRKHRMRMQDGR